MDRQAMMSRTGIEVFAFSPAEDMALKVQNVHGRSSRGAEFQ